MAQPTPYNRQYNFQNYQSSAPATPLPGNQVDLEFNSVKITMDQLLANLELIQRDDGALANGIVTSDSLSDSLSIGFTFRGSWGSGVNYLENDGVTYGAKFYIALVSNTSEAGNRPDLDDETWELVADLTSDSLNATSTSTVSVGTGAKTFTIQEGKQFVPGQRLRAVNSDGTKIMDGEVTSYASDTLVLDVDYTEGSGSASTWAIVVAGVRGPTGATGAAGSIGAASDTTISGLANNDILQYKTATGTWENKTLAAADIATFSSGNSLVIPANATAPSSLVLAEDTDNGTNTVTLIAPSAVTSNRTLTLPDASGTVALVESGIPQNSKSADYTLVLTDAGNHIFHPSADTTTRTWTIPANASVAFPVGTAVTFVNQNGAGAITIAITSDTMRLSPQGTTGSRTLAANGIATALKVTSTEWIISGTGLT